jgi:hypothetical protein
MDEPAAMDGDEFFLGVNQLGEPHELQPGEMSDGKNGRFDERAFESRLGIVKLPWTNLVTSGLTTALPFGTVYGAGVFKDSNDLEWTIIAADGKVYRSFENNGAAEVMLPPGVVIDSEVTFTQTYSGLVMFRGAAGPPLYMKTVDAGFLSVAEEANTVTGGTSENPSDGTEAIPTASSGEWINNRLFIPYETATEKDLIGISDYLNATRYQPVRSQGRVNQGSSDRLLRVFKWNENAAVCFKTGSIYGLYNLTGSLSGMVLDEITAEFGLAGRDAVVHVGKDEADQPSSVWFLVEKRGICAIVAGDQGKLQMLSVPVSREIQRLVKRIDWRNASGAQFAEWNNHVYCAVPLDEGKGYSPELIRSHVVYNPPFLTVDINVLPGKTYLWTKGSNDTSLTNGTETLSDTSEFVAQGAKVTVTVVSLAVGMSSSLKRVYTNTNNAMLVYSKLHNKWSGYDAGTGITVKRFVKRSYQGAERLFFFGADGFINLMEEGFEDEVGYELLTENVTLDTGLWGVTQPTTFAVLPGRQYTVQLGGGEVWLRNGTEEFLSPYSGTFVAQGSLISILGIASQTKTARVTRIDWVVEQEWIDLDGMTRGYTCREPGQKHFRAGTMQIETWNPKYSVSLVRAGQRTEGALVTDRTLDNTRYRDQWNRAPWDATNVNDDHGTKERQDYSVTLGEATTASGTIVAGVRYYVESADVTSACQITYNGVAVTNGQLFTGVAGVTTFTVNSGSPLVYGPGNYVFLGVNGIDFDAHQTVFENFNSLPRSAKGKAVQYRFRNTQGRAALLAASVEGIRGNQRGGSH